MNLKKVPSDAYNEIKVSNSLSPILVENCLKSRQVTHLKYI